MYEVRLSWGRAERMRVIICNSHAYYYPPLFTNESKCASKAVITKQFHNEQKSPPWFNQGGTPFWPSLMFKQSNRNSNPRRESQDREGWVGQIWSMWREIEADSCPKFQPCIIWISPPRRWQHDAFVSGLSSSFRTASHLFPAGQRMQDGDKTVCRRKKLCTSNKYIF